MGETAVIPKIKNARSGPSRTPKEDHLISGALAVLQAIPGLEVQQTHTQSRQPYEIDVSFLAKCGQKKFKVIGEAKASGEPSVLRRSAAWLKNLVAQTKHDYGVIIAPFISREGAAICQDL